MISQPAIYVASWAALEQLRQTEGEVNLHIYSEACLMPSLLCLKPRFGLVQEAVKAADVACGLSLGEYTALSFADAFRYSWSFPQVL